MTYSTLSRIVLTSIPPTDISGAFSSFELVIDHAGYRSAFCRSEQKRNGFALRL